MIRKEISEHMEEVLGNQEIISSGALKESIDFINSQIKKELNELLYEDISKVSYCNECYEPSLRQIRTLKWCIEELEKRNASKAYHYLFEYIDNYQQGFDTRIKGFELQVIQLVIVLLGKFI